MLGLPRLSVDPVLFLPFWLGTLRDACGNADTRAASMNAAWHTHSGVDSFNKYTSQLDLQYANSAVLEAVTNSTFFVSGVFRQPVAANQKIASKRDAVDTQFELYFDATGGGTLRYRTQAFSTNRVVEFNGMRSFALAHTHGGIPDVYRNGAYEGAMLSGGDSSTNDADVFIGSIYSGSQNIPDVDLEMFIWYPAVLSPTEIALLHNYSQARITPRKQWAGAQSPLATGLVYKDNIQTARVSLANETSGELSNTGYSIQSGTWKVSEDSATGERYIDCIVSGIISRRNIEINGSWEWDILNGPGNTQPTPYFVSTAVGTSGASVDSYSFAINNDERVQLWESTSGSNTARFFTAAGYAEVDQRYRIRVTKSGATIAVYIKGGLFPAWTLVDPSGGSGSNPYTDPSPRTESLYTFFDLDAGDRLYLDRQHSTVNPP